MSYGRTNLLKHLVTCAALAVIGVTSGCASTGGASEERSSSNTLSREEIMGSEASNLYDVVHRLRPRWLTVRSGRSFNMGTAIVVFQNDMYLGGAETLREMGPELAYEIEYMEGGRAAATLPGITSGQHVEGAIIIRTRPRG